MRIPLCLNFDANQEDKKRSKLWWLGSFIAVVAATLVIMWDLSFTGSMMWEEYSEDLVLGRIINMQQKGFWADSALMGHLVLNETQTKGFEDARSDVELYGAPLFKLGYKKSKELYQHFNYKLYLSQMGFQGSFYGLCNLLLDSTKIGSAIGLNKGLNKNSHNLAILYVINAAITISVLLLLCVWVGGEFGTLAALGAFSAIILSKPLRISVFNLYWVVFTMLLPTVLTAYWAKTFNQHKALSVIFAPLLALLIFFRFGCGFEFTSAIMLSSEVPVFWYFLKNRRNKTGHKKFIALALIIGIIELAAFAGAIALWAYQIHSLHPQQEYTETIEVLKEVIAKRTGAFNDGLELNKVFTDSLKKSRLSVVLSYFISMRVMVYGGVPVVFLIALCVWLKKKKARLNSQAKLPPSEIDELLLLALSLLSAVSWYFLASGHSYIHHHINVILFNIPFIPLCLGFIARDLSYVIAYRNRG